MRMDNVSDVSSSIAYTLNSKFYLNMILNMSPSILDLIVVPLLTYSVFVCVAGGIVKLPFRVRSVSFQRK